MSVDADARVDGEGAGFARVTSGKDFTCDAIGSVCEGPSSASAMSSIHQFPL